MKKETSRSVDKEVRQHMRGHDATYPPRGYSKEFADAWPLMDAEWRLDTVKRSAELRRGAAIYKDKICGRAKYDLSGWFGLQIAEEDLHRLTCAKAAPEAIAKARDRVDRLKVQLAPDKATVERALALSEAWDHAEPTAAEHGMTVPQWLAACVNIERQLVADPIGGIFAVCEHLKLDPLHMLGQMLHEPQPARTA